MHLAYSRYKEKQERNRDELAKRRERFPIKKDGKTKSCKVVEENQTSVEDAQQKHVQILEKVYGAQRLVSETSSRASVSTTTTVVSAISTTTISTSTSLKKSLNRKQTCVQCKLDESFAPVAKK